MSKHLYLAVDLGAESGRVILGTLEGSRLTLEDAHRFPNSVVQRDGHFFWDLAALEAQIVIGLRKGAELVATNHPGESISGISTNSWGVDYVWVDKDLKPLAPAYCYRDPRTEKSLERLDKQMPLREVYAETGIQLMAINTIFQLEAEVHDAKAEGKSVPPAGTTALLNIADYVNAQLSGNALSEESLASTTQMYSPVSRTWSEKILKVLGLPAGVFPKVVPSGSVLGKLRANGGYELGSFENLKGAAIIGTCSHDTGAAVAAIPVKAGSDWVYLSSGTWSLMGAELASPQLTDAAREAGFTNEQGVNGTTRFLKNIVGLWIIQECRRDWESQGMKFNYDELTQLAAAQSVPASILPINDPRLLQPGNMPGKIEAICRETNQPVPASPGQMVRTVLESLAQAYADVLKKLEALTEKKFKVLHIVGGGARNELLNQLTADATKMEVVAGPIEGTAIGNILIQGLALGHISDLNQLREVVRESFSTRTYQPRK